MSKSDYTSGPTGGADDGNGPPSHGPDGVESIDAFVNALVVQGVDDQVARATAQRLDSEGIDFDNFVTMLQQGEVEPDTTHRVTDELVLTQDPDNYALNQPDGTLTNGIANYRTTPDRQIPTNIEYVTGQVRGGVNIKNELYRLFREQKPIMAIGDAGVGKNTSLDSVCADAGLPVYRKQCGEDMTVFDMVAQTDLRDDGTFTTLQAIGKAAVFGGVAVVDEINMANDGIIDNIKSAAEVPGKRRLELPGAGVTLVDLPVTDDERIEAAEKYDVDPEANPRYVDYLTRVEKWDPAIHRGKYLHPEFRLAGTRNPPTYRGAAEINDALNDRFSPIIYDYPDIDTEVELLAERTGVDEAEIKPLVEVVNQAIREPRKHNEGLTCPVSFRRLEDTITCAKGSGITLYDAAWQKIRGYAQNAMDRREVEAVLTDHQQQLSNIPGNDGKRFVCTQCHWCRLDSALPTDSPARSNVCPSCDGPYVEERQ